MLHPQITSYVHGTNRCAAAFFLREMGSINLVMTTGIWELMLFLQSQC